MEIDLKKAEAYYSSLSESELLDCLQNTRSELDPSVISIIERIKVNSTFQYFM